MNQRIDAFTQSPELTQELVRFSTAVDACGIDKTILLLVSIRASQVNGCAFCLDLHVKEAKLHGERELRLYHLPAWRESTLFAPRERAALAWTEALTKLGELGVTDEIYQRVSAHYLEKELSDLTFAVMSINAWNRLNIAFRKIPGSADAAFGLEKANLR